RHDEPHEKEQDEIRAQIRAGHRFTSFASERSGNTVKWHIDGHDYMWAISEMLDNAKEAIFILATDWWLTPELYLRRPPAHFPEWRLDQVLLRKAQEGVKIHVVVYKEVTQAMSMSSKHTKNYLEELHPNITVMRHPDHVGAKDSVAIWSHHEKVVVVDNHWAAVGGLDLCFGRWDTHNHPLADVHPTDFSATLFPGQDYNNARVMDFKDVYNYASNALSILNTGRMPWHDVHMTLTGNAVLDIVQHFVERWNEIKKRKYREDERFPWLALPHEPEAAPNEPVSRHPHLHEWKKIGSRYKQRWHGSYHEDDSDHYSQPNNAACRVQVVRSVSDWSHGVLTEDSIQRAYIQLINEAEHFIYIGMFFCKRRRQEGGVITNLIAKALADRIIRAAKEGQKFKVFVAIPEVPGFSGDVKAEAGIKTIMAGQYRTINRGGSSIYEKIRAAGHEPLDYIRFFHLRSYDRLNSPAGYIAQIEENSGVKFHEAQVAHARLYMSQDQFTHYAKSETKQVTVSIPQETTEAIVESDKSVPQTETITVPETDDAAREIVEKFEHGADNLRRDSEVSDSVSQHLLDDRTTLLDEKWLGTEEEELNAYVSELLYIHSKLMIVDDRRVIMGSANINERSQKGDGDSEICLVVEDDDMIDSTMDGEPYQVSRFAATLRRKLFREHLGLIPPQECSSADPEITSFMRPAPHPNEDETGSEQDDLVADPIADATLGLIYGTAKRNTAIFTELFRPVPTNLVRDWAAYDNFVPKVKAGHVIPDVTLDRLKKRLNEVRGSLVECPLDFLIDEKGFHTGPAWNGLGATLPVYV
ncbi:phospholipase D, partial [Coprinellus micaceus]